MTVVPVAGEVFVPVAVSVAAPALAALVVVPILFCVYADPL